MKAVKLFIGLILFSLASNGQTPTGPQPVKTWFEYQKFNVKISLVPPRDTLSTADSGAIATKGNTVYVKNGKWRPVADTNAVIGSDTFYLTHIGTSASQINTIFAVHGGIRVSRWGDGLYMHVHFAADSLASYWADTNNLATHAWVIAQYGAGTGGSAGLDALLAANQVLTANRVAGLANFNLAFTSSQAPGGTMDVINTGGGYALNATSQASGGVAVYGNALNGTGIFGNVTTGTAIEAQVTTGNAIEADILGDGVAAVFIHRPSTNNTITKSVFIERLGVGGGGANGIGESIVFDLQRVSGSLAPSGEIQNVLLDASSDFTSISAFNFLVSSYSTSSPVLGFSIQGLASGLTTYVTPLPVFANNAAALAGGLTAGMHYRNGDIDQIAH